MMLTSKIIALIITTIILLSTITTLPLILEMNNDLKIQNNEIILASQWFENYDPNYKNENIYSDLWPNFSWYLNTTVKQLVLPTTNQTISNGNHVTSNQDVAIDNYLITNGADYYLCDIQGLNLNSFKSIKQFGNVTIYQRI